MAFSVQRRLSNRNLGGPDPFLVKVARQARDWPSDQHIRRNGARLQHSLFSACSGFFFVDEIEVRAHA